MPSVKKGDEFGDAFGDTFCDKYGDKVFSPSSVTNLSLNLFGIILNHQM